MIMIIKGKTLQQTLTYVKKENWTAILKLSRIYSCSLHFSADSHDLGISKCYFSLNVVNEKMNRSSRVEIPMTRTSIYFLNTK